MDIKERFYSKLNEAREQLDEVGNTQKGISKLLKVQKRAMKRSFAEKDPKKAAKHMKVANQAYMKLPVALGEEELNELRRPKNPDKGKKHIAQAAKAREDHEAEEYYKASDENAEARKNYMRTKKGADKVEKTEKKRIRAAKIVRKLQKIGDK